jgi:hypothetical protein
MKWSCLQKEGEIFYQYFAIGLTFAPYHKTPFLIVNYRIANKAGGPTRQTGQQGRWAGQQGSQANKAGGQANKAGRPTRQTGH